MSWETPSGKVVDNPWFRNSEKQTEVPVSGTVVHGKIPEWLEGSLIRNGPGIQKVGNTNYNHAFDGLAVLHKFEIKNGKATYQSRALESDAYEKNFAANRIVVNEFGTVAYPDPCQSIFGRLQAKFVSAFGKNKEGIEMTDNCSVNVAYYGDQLYAMTETVFIRRIDPESLKSIGEKTRIKNYCVLNTATAHPHCLEDGSIINVGNDYKNKRGPRYCFVKVPPAYNQDETAYKNATIIAAIPSRWKWSPGYFHSFGMTKDKIIFVEQPLCLDIASIVASPFSGKSFQECLKWYGSEKTRFHVISLEGGQSHPVIYESDSFFTFHHINAYEENGCIIVDLAAHNDAYFVQQATVDKGSAGSTPPEPGNARRFILPLNIEGAKPGENLVNMPGSNATAVLRAGTKSTVDLTPHNLTEKWVELPRINYDYNGKKYKFAYAVRSDEPMNIALPNTNVITKFNVTDGTTKEYVSKELSLSEPIFVADPTKSNGEEDDGIILASEMHSDPNKVSLIILNAKDMTETCKVIFNAEGAVTVTFHGLWNQRNS